MPYGRSNVNLVTTVMPASDRVSATGLVEPSVSNSYRPSTVRAKRCVMACARMRSLWPISIRGP